MRLMAAVRRVCAASWRSSHVSSQYRESKLRLGAMYPGTYQLGLGLGLRLGSLGYLLGLCDTCLGDQLHAELVVASQTEQQPFALMLMVAKAPLSGGKLCRQT